MAELIGAVLFNFKTFFAQHTLPPLPGLAAKVSAPQDAISSFQRVGNDSALDVGLQSGYLELACFLCPLRRLSLGPAPI